MENLPEEYWGWATRSISNVHEERVEAERNAVTYLQAVEVIETDEISAEFLLQGLMTYPVKFSPWHARHLAYGLVELAVELYGSGFVEKSSVFASERGRAVADLL